jgi:hypothetical protein
MGGLTEQHDPCVADARENRLQKKERSGLQSACDELIDKGAIITGE